jgi:hypothetical protein
LGLGDEQILLAQLVQRLSDQVLAYPGKPGKFSHVALAIAMPPDAGCDRAQAMSGVAVLVVEEELFADGVFEETVLTCSW